MEKILRLALVLFLAIPCKAQYVPLLNEDLVWQVEEKYSRDGGFFGPEITHTLQFLKGDTLIEGERYQKLMSLQTYFYKVGPFETIRDTTKRGPFLRALLLEDTLAKKVYYWDDEWQRNCGDKEKAKVLLYDFSLQIGDTLPNAFASFFPCSTDSSFVLQDIVPQLGADGLIRRRFVFKQYDWDEHVYTEGIGGEGLTNPFYYPAISGTDYREETVCLNKDTISIYGNCSSLAGITKNKQHLVQIYPNPILQDAQIDLGTVQKQVTILLFNSYGQVMQTQHFANTRIVPFTRASLANGMYTVQIQFSDGSKLSRKISLID